MGTLRHAALRATGVAATMVAVLLVSACGLRYDLTINSDDTIDLVYTIWDSSGMGLITKSSCSEEGMSDSTPFPDGADVTFTYLSDETYPTCQVEGQGVTLEEFNEAGDDAWSLTHSNRAYEFTMSPAEALGDGSSSSSSSFSETAIGGITADVSVTFPGEVMDSNGTVEDNTVRWTGLTSGSQELHARGRDSTPSVPFLLLIAASAILLVVAFAVISVVVSRRRKKGAQGVPAEAGSPDTGTYTGTYPSPATGSYAPSPPTQQVYAPGQQAYAPDHQAYTPGQSPLAAPSYPGSYAPSPQPHQAYTPDHQAYMPGQASPSLPPYHPNGTPATMPFPDHHSYDQESNLPTYHVPVAGDQPPAGGPHQPGAPSASSGHQA